jgi:hypothetical protein
MASPALEGIERDGVALTIARALTIANEEATARGLDPAASVITVTEEVPPPGRVWRIHYGPREDVHRRGGDLTVLVEERTGSVQQVIRGQ